MGDASHFWVLVLVNTWNFNYWYQLCGQEVELVPCYIKWYIVQTVAIWTQLLLVSVSVKCTKLTNNVNSHLVWWLSKLCWNLVVTTERLLCCTSPAVSSWWDRVGPLTSTSRELKITIVWLRVWSWTPPSQHNEKHTYFLSVCQLAVKER